MFESSLVEHLHKCYQINYGGIMIAQEVFLSFQSFLSFSCHLVKFNLMKPEASAVVFHLGGRL